MFGKATSTLPGKDRINKETNATKGVGTLLEVRLHRAGCTVSERQKMKRQGGSSGKNRGGGRKTAWLLQGNFKELEISGTQSK